MALILLCIAFPLLLSTVAGGSRSTAPDYGEYTIFDIQSAFYDGSLTSRQLVQFYLDRTRSLNPSLHAVIELNPDALADADRADRERHSGSFLARRILHGIPILLKDNIATRDRLNTTAGSLALLGSVVPRDAGVVQRLRQAGAIILGKASLSEWASFRSFPPAPTGWSARGGRGVNPYNAEADPCGSSTGSAIAAAAGMVSVTLGTETHGSIICPSGANSVVGIKPTVGLTSRAGVVPISPRQDSVGPITRTVADAVAVLEAIVGYDERDPATGEAVGFVPVGGYRQFLKTDGLKGKRVGIVRKEFFNYAEGSVEEKAFERHFQVMRQKGAILLDNLEIANASFILNVNKSGEWFVMFAEFKPALKAYLSELVISPIRSLADAIAFNNEHKVEEMIEEYGQRRFLESEKTNGFGAKERAALKRLSELNANGLKSLMEENKLDAVVTPGSTIASVTAIGGYPGISVPAGYDKSGIPFGICFSGLRGSEPKLIEIAYAFEQATKVRKPPSISSLAARVGFMLEKSF